MSTKIAMGHDIIFVECIGMNMYVQHNTIPNTVAKSLSPELMCDIQPSQKSRQRIHNMFVLTQAYPCPLVADCDRSGGGGGETTHSHACAHKYFMINEPKKSR